ALTAQDLLVLAGSLPSGLPEDTYRRLMAPLAARGVRVVVDAGGEALRRVLPHRPFLVKPNHHELGELFGCAISPTDLDMVAECARALQQQGARNVLVSMGGAGAVLVDEQHRQHRLAAPQGRVVNTVGAGDSMVAGFLAGWLDSGDYGQALRLGTACGSATAFTLGLAEKADAEALLEQMQ
ncbi:MAG: bifunctional hydroxymethylpyrimidine kinase/phosphomethylpyrimidine kinase, partial [Oscillospiraceae bacterium]|nr:bifunctional hydroxymethylpyrimidine kinase/phosphomethylpyrimidine kinase [Oscillospiraceae bacterium]